MRKLLPVILAVAGLGAGIGAGILLKPSAEAATPSAAHASAAAGEDAAAAEGTEIVALNNQFVVPVIDESEVEALVVLSLDLEVDAGSREAVHRLEPKLRDAFLSVLFEHANAGGFHGAFTSSSTMTLLREALRESAEKTLGDIVRQVLITNIVRQQV